MKVQFPKFYMGFVLIFMLPLFQACTSKSEFETEKFSLKTNSEPKKSLQTEDSSFESLNSSNDTVLTGAAKAASGAVLGSSNDQEQLFVVNVKSVNIRENPSIQAQKIAVLSRGENVRIRMIKQDWGQIGDSRWVYLPHLKLANP